MKYGSSITVSKNSLAVVINGYIISVFKGVNTGRWQVTLKENIWRKQREAIPAILKNR